MNDQVLMNDEAARSPAGEILNQATTQTPPTETPTTPPSPETPPTTSQTPPVTDKPVVPEAYADFKAPDNYTIDKALIETALPIFKELGLTQDQAQKLVDIQVSRELALAKAPQDTYTTMRTGWQTETKAAFPGAALDAAKVDIGRVLNVLPPDVSKGFREAMDLTGAGDHPAVFKAMQALSAFITEGKHVAGKGPSIAGQAAPGSNNRPDTAHALYPNLK